MDLTQYKLEELIENSKKKINVPLILYKNLKLFTIVLVIEALILCPLTWNFINPSIYLWIVAVLAPIKTSFNLILPRLQKKTCESKIKRGRSNSKTAWNSYLQNETKACKSCFSIFKMYCE